MKEVTILDKKWIKIIGFAGMMLGGAATLIANWSQEKQMDLMIEEKVREALAEGEEESE